VIIELEIQNFDGALSFRDCDMTLTLNRVKKYKNLIKCIKKIIKNSKNKKFVEIL
jgi:hypothetical protein